MPSKNRTRCVLETLLFLAVAGGPCHCFGVNQSTCAPPLSCISIQDCKNRLGALGGHHQHVHNSFVFKCAGQSPDDMSVCCPPSAKETSITTKMLLLPNEVCGISFGNRIIGGTAAGLGQFPWMALLGYTNISRPDSPKKVFLCGGSLITERYVLTAAHCFKNSSHSLEFVRLGEHTLSKDKDCSCGGSLNLTGCPDEFLYCSYNVVDIQIEDIIKHDHFNDRTIKNDIALLRLKSKAMFTDFVGPICLPFGVKITGEEQTNYTVAGWGWTDNNDLEVSDVLQSVFLRSWALADCKIYHENLDDGQLCAGDGGKDACHGDSGGPMMKDYSMENMPTKMYQIGIVSYGGAYRCGAETYPTVYTRVTTYLAWILDNIAE